MSTKPLSKQNLGELRETAAELDVTIPEDATTKKQIVAVIEAASQPDTPPADPAGTEPPAADSGPQPAADATSSTDASTDPAAPADDQAAAQDPAADTPPADDPGYSLPDTQDTTVLQHVESIAVAGNVWPDGEDPADSETRCELDDGTIELRRPITRFSRRGDWQNPWREPGYLVYFNDKVDPQDGVRRDGDQAVKVVQPSREDES